MKLIVSLAVVLALTVVMLVALQPEMKGVNMEVMGVKIGTK